MFTWVWKKSKIQLFVFMQVMVHDHVGKQITHKFFLMND